MVDNLRDAPAEDAELMGKQVVFRLPPKMYRRMLAAADENELLPSEFLRLSVSDRLALEQCVECGEMVPGDALFCPYCKTEFEEEEEPEDEESEKED